LPPAAVPGCRLVPLRAGAAGPRSDDQGLPLCCCGRFPRGKRGVVRSVRWGAGMRFQGISGMTRWRGPLCVGLVALTAVVAAVTLAVVLTARGASADRGGTPHANAHRGGAQDTSGRAAGDASPNANGRGRASHTRGAQASDVTHSATTPQPRIQEPSPPPAQPTPSPASVPAARTALMVGPSARSAVAAGPLSPRRRAPSTNGASTAAKPTQLVEHVAASARHSDPVALTGTLAGVILGVFVVMIVSGYRHAGAAATRRGPAHRRNARHRKPGPVR
jgi:hypothetical protein